MCFRITKLIFFLLMMIGGGLVAILFFAMGRRDGINYIYGGISILMSLVGVAKSWEYYVKITKGEKCKACDGRGYVSERVPYYGSTPDYEGNRDPNPSTRILEGYISGRKTCERCNGKGMLK